MINEFAKDPYLNKSTQVRNHYNQVIEYFKDKLKKTQNILDIGDRNPLTDILEQKLNVKIYNTVGDIDESICV